MKKTFEFLKVGLVAITICLPALTQAQPPGDDDVNDVPLDGGLSILIATGIGYGAKKALEKRKKAVGHKQIL